MMRRRALAVLLLIALGGVGCNAFRRPAVPMPTVVHPAAEAGTEGPLVVLLPGFFDRPDTFDQEGLVEVIRTARPDAEIVAADAHIGYYRRGAILERIDADILAPARRRGRDEIWLVGTSLGGGGALLLGERYRDQIAGLILLAPYVGPDDLLDHVTTVGTVDGFEPESERDRAFRDVWSWILGRDAHAKPQILLGYGRDDRSADDHARLAEHLDAESIVVLDGGHDWPIWRDALAALLHRGALPR